VRQSETVTGTAVPEMVLAPVLVCLPPNHALTLDQNPRLGGASGA